MWSWPGACAPGSVHLIIGGHTHNALNEGGLDAGNIVNGIPIVQAGKGGQFLGEVDLEVGEGAVVTHARLNATIDLPVDAAFERDHVAPLLGRVRPYRERVIGRVAGDADLGADAVRSRFAAGESALANFVADALVAQARAHGYPADFAMIDATSVSCGLPVGGALAFGDWFAVMPYADALCLLRLSGRQLRALLQDNAVRIDRPDEPHTERGYLHFSGEVRYTVHLGPARGQARAGDIRVTGEPVDDRPDRTYLVATTGFVRGLAAAWEECAAATLSAPLFGLGDLPREWTRFPVRDLLLDHIAAHGGVLPEGGANGRPGELSPVNGICAVRKMCFCQNDRLCFLAYPHASGGWHGSTQNDRSPITSFTCCEFTEQEE